MSNIQLWMSPTRDFTVFFPVLHIIILGSMQLSDLLATYLMYYYHWDYMQLFICGIMMVDLLILTVCTRHFRMFKKFPLFGVDWLGSDTLGGTCSGNHVRFQLWRLLRLVEQPGDLYGQPFRSRYIRVLFGTHVLYPTSLP